MPGDPRLIGRTAEAVFLSLLNERGILAQAFDSEGIDGVAFDVQNAFFPIGQSPFYVQIKCRGSKTNRYNPQGHSPRTFQNIKTLAARIHIPEDSLYLAAGFYRQADIRTLVYFVIPFSLLPLFKSSGQYRFSTTGCAALAEVHTTIKVL